MKRMAVILSVALFGLALLAGVALAADGKVFQGTCVTFDEAKNSMVLKNDEADKNPVDKSLAEVTFDLSEATLGVRPTPGDKIRVGYVMANNKFMAHKVMNVTKQNIFKK